MVIRELNVFRQYENMSSGIEQSICDRARFSRSYPFLINARHRVAVNAAFTLNHKGMVPEKWINGYFSSFSCTDLVAVLE